MTDLAYCYSHMADEIIRSIDVPTDAEDILSQELDVPAHAIPPNPDDCEALPSYVHPSYPYGDPTNMNHPASRPHTEGNPTSRALFIDSMYMGAAISTLCWDELALDHLLPVDKEKADAESAMLARETAAGNTHAQNPRGDSVEEEPRDEENQG